MPNAASRWLASATVWHSRKSVPVCSFTASAMLTRRQGGLKSIVCPPTLNCVRPKTVVATCRNMSSIRFMLYS